MTPTPTDPPVELCSVLGTQVGCAVEGPSSAAPIIMIHGVPGGAFDFRYLAPLLADRFRVLRMELPGFGAARAADWDDYSPRGRARLITGLADRMGLTRFTVLGHSLGGPAALAAAALSPERVQSLVLVCSVGLRRHRGMVMAPPVARAMMSAARLPILRERLLRFGRDTYTRMRFPGADTLTVRELRIHAANVAGLGFQGVRETARRVVCPTLVAWAADDPQVEPAIGEELRRAIRGADAVAYPSGGHNIQKTQAADLALRIRALLGEETDLAAPSATHAHTGQRAPAR